MGPNNGKSPRSVNPTPIAQAVAATFGATSPKRMAPVRFLPCPSCKGIPRQMTVCSTCNGLLRVEALG